MNYKKHYDLLISRAKSRLLEGYSENHHIIPKCLNGDNSNENLVQLTPEEHYVAHQLLIKIYPDNRKLIYSAHMMGNTRSNNKSYGWLRKKHSINIKEQIKLNKNNFGKGKRKLSDEQELYVLSLYNMGLNFKKIHKQILIEDILITYDTVIKICKKYQVLGYCRLSYKEELYLINLYDMGLNFKSIHRHLSNENLLIDYDEVVNICKKLRPFGRRKLKNSTCLITNIKN